MKTETVAATTLLRGSQTAAKQHAIELLRDGEVVALPTETVYGLAADALNPVAVAKIFEVKERPRFDPLIVHLPDEQWLERVAIVDWDVHHGNGTEEIFRDDPTVFFVSLHQWPFYPGTGGPDDQGDTTLNIPLSAGSGDEEYERAFDHVVEPAVRAFEPELVIVSAGFDAHTEDPLASMNVAEDGFRELARRSAALAPRAAAVLEGGYNLSTLPRLVNAALEGFRA